MLARFRNWLSSRRGVGVEGQSLEATPAIMDTQEFLTLFWSYILQQDGNIIVLTSADKTTKVPLMAAVVVKGAADASKLLAKLPFLFPTPEDEAILHALQNMDTKGRMVN